MALAVSLLVHAALFAAIATLTVGRLNRPEGNEITPNVTFGLVVNQPPVEEPPPAEPSAAPPPPEPAPPPPLVVEPAAPPPADPLTTIAAFAPPANSIASEPTMSRPEPRLAKSTRAASPATAARGDRGGDSVFTPAVCTYRAAPDFPATSRRERRQGSVLLVVTVDARGRVENVRVLTTSGDARLDAAAQAAARRCRFRAAMRDGVPIACEVRVPYTFRLDQ